jgi:HEAT repeat protein
MIRWGLLISIVLNLALSHIAFAQNPSVDQALEQLKTYKLGDDSKPLQTIEDAVVRSHSDSAVREKLLESFRQVLQSETSFGARQFVCRQLALIGTENEVSVLAPLLPNPKLSSLARYALARISSEKVDQALIAALKNSNGREKRGIINTLGHRRSQSAVEPLASMVTGGDREVAGEAALALGRIGTEQTQGLLKTLSQQAKALDSNVWAEAYLICADRLVSQGNIHAAVGGYVEVFTSDMPGHIRASAYRGLVLYDSSHVVSLLVSGLSDNHPKISQMAATLVRQIPGNKVTAALTDTLIKLPPSVQVQLIYALADRGDKTALPSITNKLKSDRAEVRIAALEALGNLGDASSIDVLVRAAVLATNVEEEVALKNLRRLRGSEIDTAMISRLENANPKQEVILIQVLEQRNAVAAASALIQAARSENRTVRTASLKALRTLASKNEVSGLIDLLVSADGGNSELIRQTLVSVVRRCACEPQAVKDILAQQSAAKDFQQRSNLLLALGDLGVADGLSILRSSLKDNDEKIRYAAIQALSAWPNAEPLPDLLHVVTTSEAKTHRILALRGYIQMLDQAQNISAQQKLHRYQEAMKLAESDQEKKRILGVLANVKTIAAMQYARTFLSNANLKQEAAQACVAIGQVVFTRDTKATRAAMEAVLAAGVMNAFQEQGRKIIENMDALKNYLANWEVAGPYVQEGKNHAQLFDIKFDPEIPNTKVQWKPMSVTKLNNHPAYLDLLATLNGGEQRVAYLRTTIPSEEEKGVRLEIFSDDGVKAWLNGNVVLSLNVARPILETPDVAEVRLKKGANSFMLKVTQNNMPWGAMVRVQPAKKTTPKLGKGFRLHTINAESKFEAAGVLDVNRDGKLDIFCGGFWYQAPNWQKHFVRELKEQHEYYNDFANLPMDVDGDGWVDIVSVAYFNQTACWIRNPGKARGNFEVIEIDKPGSMETAIAVDINGDRQLDLLPNIGGSVAWYEYKPDPSANKYGVKWIKHNLPKQATGHGIGAGDINGDGRCDVVGPNGWLEQPANDKDPWKWHGEFQLGSTSIPILVQDVDGDQDGDIVWGMGHNYGIFWLEQIKKSDGSRSWQRHEIDKEWSQPHFMMFVNLDADPQEELLTGKRYRAHNGNDPGGKDPLCVYYYDFDRNTKKWTRHLIHEGGKVGLGINTACADLDADGDLDIVAPGKSGLYLIENLLK